MPLIQKLRDARLLKDLSQTEVGARSGLAQSHLSKIEQGHIDPQLSNVIELARVLELELRLVPRKAIPAVDSVIRSVTPEVTSQHQARLKVDLVLLTDLLRRTNTTLPLTDITTVTDTLMLLQHLLIPEHEIPRVSKAVKQLQRLLRTEHPDDSQSVADPDDQSAARRALQTLREVRNQLVHASLTPPTEPRSAYAFDEDDDA